MNRGHNRFNNSWLSDGRFKLWLAKDVSVHRAKCKVCGTSINIDNMGVDALVSHAKGKTHNKKLKENEESALTAHLFFGNRREVASSSSGSADSFIVATEVTRAEIWWTLKVVLSHFPLRSCIDLNELFQIMFPDSQIAEKFQLDKTKCSYFINHGIAPYYKDMLLKSINTSPFFSVSFDESLNSVMQQEQMDVQIRYWDEKMQISKTHYLDSQYIRRPNHINLANSINESIKGLNADKMTQLAMDGPSTNWAVLNVLQKERDETDIPPLHDIGSCGLHVVNGAFQKGVVATGWQLDKILKAMFKLFQDSPARRDTYIRINTSETFPKRFCPTRWVESEDVAIRALETWDYVAEVIKEFSKQVPSKQPKQNKSYALLVEQHTDPFMKFKIQLFKDVACILKDFLVQFQTDYPMIPFLSDRLERIMRRVMKMFIRNDVIKQAVTPKMLIKIDVNNSNHSLDAGKIVNLPTASKALLNAVTCAGGKKQLLLKSIVTLLKTFVSKLQERSPLKYVLVRAAASLSPDNMANDKDSCIIKFGVLVDKMFAHNRLNSVEADGAKLQYEDFLCSTVPQNLEKFNNFDTKEQRLDSFLGNFVCGVENFKYFWKVCKFVFTLHHGQSQTERGFNINKDLLVENLHGDSIINQRIVYDQLCQVKLHELEIGKELIISCRLANKKYKAALEAKKTENVNAVVSQKRKLVQEELADVKRHKLELEKSVALLIKDADKYSREAEEKRDFAMLSNANKFRVTASQKQGEVTTLEKTIENLMEKLKSEK